MSNTLSKSEVYTKHQEGFPLASLPVASVVTQPSNYAAYMSQYDFNSCLAAPLSYIGSSTAIQMSNFLPNPKEGQSRPGMKVLRTSLIKRKVAPSRGSQHDPSYLVSEVLLDPSSRASATTQFNRPVSSQQQPGRLNKWLATHLSSRGAQFSAFPGHGLGLVGLTNTGIPADRLATSDTTLLYAGLCDDLDLASTNSPTSACLYQRLPSSVASATGLLRQPTPPCLPRQTPVSQCPPVIFTPAPLVTPTWPSVPRPELQKRRQVLVSQAGRLAGGHRTGKSVPRTGLVLRVRPNGESKV
ncbi:unnamed protein product [Protopolystoma xenopodis]|uniref:Uncharacterized protein n=1 Tax=Protopolystoma xenopodis TaxID=117903 RepID=A0A448WQB4_9PLAT|nr:unnamed protein product [Protopolystoma xenopodis]